MSRENDYKPIELPPLDIAKEQKMVDRHFTLNTGLNEDAISDWLQAQFLEPVMHYRDYYNGKCPHLVNYIMEKSSLEKVKEFDQLVDEYNSGLEQIRKNNDQAAAMSYLDKAVKLIRG